MNEKRIVLGITGSIAAYRTCEVARNLQKQNIPVQVVMTENAARFVGPITFEALTDRPVYVGKWDEGMVHIQLKNMATVYGVIPATANILAKFASGIADDIVTTTYAVAANVCPVVVAPSMNPNMYSSAPVQRNLKQLQADGVIILDSAEGEAVCGDVGKGKMADTALVEKTLIELHRKAING